MTPDQLTEMKAKWAQQDENARLQQSLRQRLRRELRRLRQPAGSQPDLAEATVKSSSAPTKPAPAATVMKAINTNSSEYELVYRMANEAFLNLCAHERQLRESQKAVWKARRRIAKAQARADREAILYAEQRLQRRARVALPDRAEALKKRALLEAHNEAERVRLKLDDPVPYTYLFEMQARSIPCVTEAEHTLHTIQLPPWTPFHEMTTNSAVHSDPNQSRVVSIKLTQAQPCYIHHPNRSSLASTIRGLRYDTQRT